MEIETWVEGCNCFLRPPCLPVFFTFSATSFHVFLAWSHQPTFATTTHATDAAQGSRFASLPPFHESWLRPTVLCFLSSSPGGKLSECPREKKLPRGTLRRHGFDSSPDCSWVWRPDVFVQGATFETRCCASCEASDRSWRPCGRVAVA